MRIKLNLYQSKSEQFIPINYQYAIASFIYNSIESSNPQYSKWLHDKGFMSGSKTFKFFTFSMLNLPKREIMKDRFFLSFPKLSFIVSILSEKAIEHFIAGMFLQKKMKISDRKSEAEFYINSVEAIPEPNFSNIMKFRTISPIILSKKGIYKDKESEIFLNPLDSDYFLYFKKNIEEKYIAYCKAAKKQIIYNTIEKLEILNKPKEHLISIKPGRFDETKVKCYSFDFKIEGPPEMLKLAYDVGIGKMCSGGFGCIEPIFHN